jgi:hypothetical protein
MAFSIYYSVTAHISDICIVPPSVIIFPMFSISQVKAFATRMSSMSFARGEPLFMPMLTN